MLYDSKRMSSCFFCPHFRSTDLMSKTRWCNVLVDFLEDDFIIHEEVSSKCPFSGSSKEFTAEEAKMYEDTLKSIEAVRRKLFKESEE